MALVINDNYNYISNQSLAGLPFGTGSLGGNNSGTYTGNVAGVDFNAFAGNQYFTVQRGNLTVSNTRIVGGEYDNVTVTGTGDATLDKRRDRGNTLRSAERRRDALRRRRVGRRGEQVPDPARQPPGDHLARRHRRDGRDGQRAHDGSPVQPRR